MRSGGIRSTRRSEGGVGTRRPTTSVPPVGASAGPKTTLEGGGGSRRASGSVDAHPLTARGEHEDQRKRGGIPHA